MKVAQLWRFPVKSLQGERLESLDATPEGFAGDRGFALFDVDTGFGLTARRVPELLFASASLRPDGRPVINLPDGSIAADDEQLSAWLGRRVVLRSAAEVVNRRYENPADFEREATSRWEPFDGSSGAFHDSERAPVSLVALSTMGDWPIRRFRTNVVFEGAEEHLLLGHQVALGGAVMRVGMQIVRCVMITRPQPGQIERDLDVLRVIQRQRHGFLGVGATVLRPGTVSVGDQLELVESAHA